MNINASVLHDSMNKSGIACDHTQADQLYTFYRLFSEYNISHDLSRLRRDEDILLKHFIDSALVLRYIKQLPSPLLDIGTGPGFPGMPLKILSPETKIILAEPRRLRIEFMNMVIERLGLTEIEVYPHLVTEDCSFEINGVITRAFESASGTLDRVNPFLPRNGRIILMKGPAADKDIADLDARQNEYYTLEEDHPYTLPNSSHERRLLVYRKTKDYERRTFMIMKDGTTPLGDAIISAENKRFKELRQLAQKPSVKKTGRTLVCGQKILLDNESLLNNLNPLLVLPDGYRCSHPAMLAMINSCAQNRSLLIIKKALYNEIDVFSTNGPLMAVDTDEFQSWSPATSAPRMLAIPFQDPSNVGAVIRSAVAFGIKDFLILKECAHPFHPKSVRSSGGAVFSSNFYQAGSLEETIEQCTRFSTLFPLALDMHGIPLSSVGAPDRFVLFPGLEGCGIPEQTNLTRITVPIAPEIESLNAATATAIALYELCGIRESSPVPESE